MATVNTKSQPPIDPRETAQWIPDWDAGEEPELNNDGISDSSFAVYSIVVHDDDKHACRDFVEMLQELFEYEEPAAYQLTHAIALQGRAIVWTGLQDIAERKAQQAREFQPAWRRGQSITAPRHVSQFVSPLVITVELNKQASKSESTS